MATGLRWRQQPDVHTAIDQRHSLATRLVAAHLPDAGRGAFDLTDGTWLPNVNQPAHGVSRWGYESVNIGNWCGGGMIIGTAHKLSLQPPISIMWVGTTFGTAGGYATFYGASPNNTDAAPYSSYVIVDVPAGNVTFECNNAGSTVAAPAHVVPAAGSSMVIIGVVDSSIQACYLNGVLGGSGTTGFSTINYTSTAVFGIPYGGTGTPNNKSTAFGAVWNRTLSIAEISQLSIDPFCFLR